MCYWYRYTMAETAKAPGQRTAEKGEGKEWCDSGGKKLPPQLRRKPLGEKRGKRGGAAYNALRGTSI